MTEAKVNFNFEEAKVGQKQVVVNNTYGRTLDHLELVLLNGYFGEVREFDGIAAGADGVINIDSDREIATSQIGTSDTFVVGAILYFLPSSSVAGKLRSASGTGRAAVGIVTAINNGTSVTFKPFAQRTSAAGIVVA